MSQLVPVTNKSLIDDEFFGAWTPKQLDLIKKTVAKGATDEELKLFLYRCKNLSLDPLKPGQIYFIKYGTNPGTVVIGIDGFRARAQRTGKHQGTKRGVIKDEKGKIVGAWAEVSREGWVHPARDEIVFAEYDTGRGNWLDMPDTMIKKVAEAAALRMAFPDELGGLYAYEEMEKKSESNFNIRPQQPEPGDGIQDGGPYRITFGQYALRSLEEVGVDNLRKYIVMLEARAKKEGKEIVGQVKDFITKAEAYIGAFENTQPEDWLKEDGFDVP